MRNTYQSRTWKVDIIVPNYLETDSVLDGRKLQITVAYQAGSFFL